MSTSSLIAAPAANVQAAIRTSEGQACVVPVWDSISIIRDPYTEARSGKVSMTAVMLANADVLRTDGWTQLSYKIA